MPSAPLPRRAVPAAGLLAALLCAGCGSGGSGGAGFAAGGPGLTTGVAATEAPWQVLDLATGAVQAQAAVADLAVNPAYRDRLLVFRLVPAGTALLGQAPGSPARQGDELQAPAVHGGFAIAALELTRAQWRRLAGDAPWQDPAWGGLAGGDDDQLPATGMSAARAAAVLAAAGARLGLGLALPHSWQWEVAARAGGTAAMPWGDDLRPSVAAAFARTAADGPARVGSLLPNALGLHDCCGNVWEWTADGGMRGGSWADPPALARPANRDALLAGDGAPHVGLRPVYRR